MCIYFLAPPVHTKAGPLIFLKLSYIILINGKFLKNLPNGLFPRGRLQCHYSMLPPCNRAHIAFVTHVFSPGRSKAETKTNFFTVFELFYSTTSFSANDVCFLLSQTSLDTLLSLFWSLFSFLALAFGGPTSPLAATAFCNTKNTSHGAIPTVLRKWDIFTRKCSIPQARGTACSKDLVRTEHLLTDLGSKHEPGCSQVKTLRAHPDAPGLSTHWKQVRNVLSNKKCIVFSFHLVIKHTLIVDS